MRLNVNEGVLKPSGMYVKILVRILIFLFLFLILFLDSQAQEPIKPEKNLKTNLEINTYRDIHRYTIVELKPRIEWRYKKLTSTGQSVFNNQGLGLNSYIHYRPSKSLPLVVTNRSGTDVFKKTG